MLPRWSGVRDYDTTHRVRSWMVDGSRLVDVRGDLQEDNDLKKGLSTVIQQSESPCSHVGKKKISLNCSLVFSVLTVHRRCQAGIHIHRRLLTTGGRRAGRGHGHDQGRGLSGLIGEDRLLHLAFFGHFAAEDQYCLLALPILFVKKLQIALLQVFKIHLDVVMVYPLVRKTFLTKSGVHKRHCPPEST